MVKKNGKKSFLLLDVVTNKIIAKFENRYPRQAALKAANKGVKDIKLLERGTKNKVKGGYKIHRFVGERTKIPKPIGAPNWMPNEVYKPMVKKIGVERLLIEFS